MLSGQNREHIIERWEMCARNYGRQGECRDSLQNLIVDSWIVLAILNDFLDDM